ncbi:MAG: hypothetical protein ACI89J_000141 [Hyphomicrobiaceae bacterium]|jgi:hypothetical protein
MDTNTLPKISSFAVPTDADLAVMHSMSDDDKRALIATELERRNELEARSMTRDEILEGLRPPKNG